jgi:CrcB protein
MKNFLLVFLGGGLGSALRYGISFLITTVSFPYATLCVNVVGCFLIGLFMAIYHSHSPQFLGHSSTLLFFTTGFCGGFTTFSTFSKESFTMLQQQQWGLFFVYVLSSVILCIVATSIGFYLGK